MRPWLLVVLGGCSFRAGSVGSSGGPDATGDGTGGDARAGWWDPAWHYRMPLTVTNSATTAAGLGLQVAVARDLSAAPCTSNRDEPRIVYQSGELARVIDEVGPPQYLWFKLAAPLAPGATSSGEYWLYCGNPTPSAAPADATQVFDFFDPFDALDTTTVWTQTNVASAAAGKVTIGGTGGQNSGITTQASFASNQAVDIAVASSAVSATYWWVGFRPNKTLPPWVLWYVHDGSHVAPAFKSSGAEWDGRDLALDLNSHIYGIETYGDHATYRFEDTVADVHTYAPSAPPPATMPILLWSYTNNASIAVDWVRVRQAVDPLPVVTVGAPEAY